MVLSQQAQRNWKIASYICTSIAGIYGIFFAEYHIPTLQDLEDASPMLLSKMAQKQLQQLQEQEQPQHQQQSQSQQQQNHVLTPIQIWVHERMNQLLSGSGTTTTNNNHPMNIYNNNNNNNNNNNMDDTRISTTVESNISVVSNPPPPPPTTNNKNHHDENITELRRIAKGYQK